MSSCKKTSQQGDMSSLEPEEDFASYGQLMKEATDLYNSIIKDDVTWEEKELSEVQQSKLALCRAICEQLLADNDVLLEDRIKLNYYMSGHQEYPIRDFYLHQALLSVGALEKLNASGGKIRPDPLRQILETQMRLAEEKAYGPRTPVSLVDNTQHGAQKRTFVQSSQHVPYMQNASQIQNPSQKQGHSQKQNPSRKQTYSQKQSSSQKQNSAQKQHGSHTQVGPLNQLVGYMQQRSNQSFVHSKQHGPYMQQSHQKKRHELRIQPVGYTQLNSEIQPYDLIQNGLVVKPASHMQSFVPQKDASCMKQVPNIVHGQQVQNGRQIQTGRQIQNGQQIENDRQIQNVQQIQNGNQTQYGSQTQTSFQIPPLEGMQRVSLFQSVAPVQHGPTEQHIHHMRPSSPTLRDLIQRLSPTQPAHNLQSITQMQQRANMRHNLEMQPFSPMKDAFPIRCLSPMQSVRDSQPIPQMLSISPMQPGFGAGSHERVSPGVSMTQPPTPTVIITGPSAQDEAREVRRTTVAFLQMSSMRRERKGAIKKEYM